MTTRWLAVIGIGEDGVEGLSPAARALIGGAGLVVGGARHLALADALIAGERLAWPSPLVAAFPAILARRPAPVAVLASGDPFCHGVGSLLAPLVEPDEMVCLPAPSAFSLACARLGWALQDVSTMSLCGHPIATLAPLLHPGRRILALSADASTPGAVAEMLRARGFGASRVRVLEALGGPRERVRELTDPLPCDIAALNLLAIELRADTEARIIPLTPGLPEEAFEHDGQITKREVRAMTLAALSPRRGELLWDIGCGSGSVGIEWMLCDPANRAIALDARADRAARAARNAVALGVPTLRVQHGEAPAALSGLAPPNAVFVGGGAGRPGVLDAAWGALPSGGRLVANSVTIETDALLFAARARFGGTLTRVAVERLDTIGPMHAFRPAMTVTQFAAIKP
jgi:precorrin-6Y C5,15-methyltransferase (decarboxylating)